MILRSEVLIEFEKAFADEAYDGALGALTEERATRNVRRLAEVAVEVVQDELDERWEHSDHTAAKYYRRMRAAENEMQSRELHHFETEKRVLDALGFIDQTGYANDDNRDDLKWSNAEVLELLGEIRGFLAPEPSTTDGSEHV